MFKNLTLLLACIASANAFAPSSFTAPSRAIASGKVVSTLFDTALSADVEESDDVAAPVVEEPAAPAKPAQEEEDINCVAYVVNLSYGEWWYWYQRKYHLS